MENKIQLTDQERAFFFHLLANSGNGVVDLAGAEYLLGDNYSCFKAKDLISDEYSFARVGGFMSSLESKGVIQFDEEIGNPLWWITNAGVYLTVEMFETASTRLTKAITKVIELSKADIYVDLPENMVGHAYDEQAYKDLQAFRDALDELAKAHFSLAQEVA